MKKLFFILILLSGCAKEQLDQRMVQLSVEGSGCYSVTYGTSKMYTLEAENYWTTSLWVNEKETICLSVKTFEKPATLYINYELQEGLVYCRSLYVEPNSIGVLDNCDRP